MSRCSPTSLFLIFVMSVSVATTLPQDVVFPEERSNVCILTSGELGECIDIYSCPSVLETFRDKYPVHCGFIRFTPIVCCPISNEI